jgi:hypothetical protein
MVCIPRGVTEEDLVELLDVVFVQRDIFEVFEDGLEQLPIAANFRLVPSAKRLQFDPLEDLSDF